MSTESYREKIQAETSLTCLTKVGENKSYCLLLWLYWAVGGSVTLALVVQWMWSRAGCYTGPSVWDRVEWGPGVGGSWCM